MRITGGQSRGRALSLLKGFNIRPTSDRVKESVFNILGQDVSCLNVLDLFAGTGALGIEALSRGAMSAVFIDNSIQSIKIIEKNLALCGYEDRADVLLWDLMKGFPGSYSGGKRCFDIVFIDPPYGKNLVTPVLEDISGQGLMADSSVAVVESSRDDELPAAIGGLGLFDTRIYGTTKIDFYGNKEKA